MPILPCPHCKQPLTIDAAAREQSYLCSHCGQPFRVGRRAEQATLPATKSKTLTSPPVVARANPIINVDAAPRRSRKPISAAKIVTRLMLFATAAWIACLGVTFAWCLVRAIGLQREINDPDAGATVAAIAVVSGSLCWWFFETLAYGAVMLVLWVVRENLRE